MARFVERHQDALGEVFGAVLGLCAKAGLVGVNVVAVDGSKVSANASREATVDYERLAREVIEDARAIDAEEDERFGDRRGDELPPELATSNGRQQWFKAARRWLDDERAGQAAPIPRDRAERVREAKRRMDEQLFTELRAEEAYQRYRARARIAAAGGSGPNTVPKPYVAAARCRRARSTPPIRTRAWSRASTASAGLQRPGRRQRAPDRDRGRDRGRLTRLRAPRTDRQRRPPRARTPPASASPGVVLADSGYWHTEQIDRLTGDGIPVLIPPESGLRRTPRPGWSSGIYDFMRHVLATEHGNALYRQRQHLIETRLRQHQTQPRLHPFSPTRPSRRPDRMATDHGHPQPAQAPQAPPRHHGGLTAAGRPRQPARRARALTSSTD